MNRSILVLGPAPPPFGGVSTHIVRFMALVRERGWNATLCPYTGSVAQTKAGKIRDALGMVMGAWKALAAGRSDVVHLHYAGLGYFLAVAPFILMSGSRTALTLHSVRVLQDVEKLPGFLRRGVLGLIDRFDLLVPVRDGIGEELRAGGLSRPEMVVMPAFLPPAVAETDRGRLPAGLAEALARAEADRRLRLCCAAYYLGPGYGHDDIYGVELLLAALAPANGGPDRDVELAVMVSNPPGNDEQRRAEAAVRNAADALPHVRLSLHYGEPMVPVLAACDAFLRPSREDGDSVAVREAMALGVPVLASDVVYRPEGVTLLDITDATTAAAGLAAFTEGLSGEPRGELRIVIDEERREAIDRFLEALAG